MARMEMTMATGAVTSAVEASAEAYYQLGLMCSAGRDCPVDNVAAHKWFNVALARGYRPAADARADLAAQMSPVEIAAALREARAFLTLH